MESAPAAQGAVCFSYEVELVGWRARQLRDDPTLRRHELSHADKMAAAVLLKAEAAPLVKHGCFKMAREIYRDCGYYLEREHGVLEGGAAASAAGERETAAAEAETEAAAEPAGQAAAAHGGVEATTEGAAADDPREAERAGLLLSVLLNESMCLLKVAAETGEVSEYNRIVQLCTEALSFDQRSVKALYRRALARTALHDYADAHTDLIAAGKLDPKSRDVREALTKLKEARGKHTKRDAMIAGKSLGSKAGPIARAPPGGGLRIQQDGDVVCWMDIGVEAAGDQGTGGAPGVGGLGGRIEMELFAHAPLTTENFACLCTGQRGTAPSASLGQIPLHYKGCGFHRLLPGYLIQGGDIVYGNGTGCASIYPGGAFRDERLLRSFDEPGLLAMANNGPDTNGCQFFITLAATPSLNGKGIVFGRVRSGLDVLLAIERSVPVDKADRPTARVFIADCGEYGKTAGQTTGAKLPGMSADEDEDEGDGGARGGGTTGVPMDVTDSISASHPPPSPPPSPPPLPTPSPTPSPTRPAP